MRTTVNIEDDLLARAKERAVKEGKGVGAVINDALRADLCRAQPPVEPGHREPVITFRGQGVRPGVDLNSMAELLDVMDGLS